MTVSQILSRNFLLPAKNGFSISFGFHHRPPPLFRHYRGRSVRVKRSYSGISRSLDKPNEIIAVPLALLAPLKMMSQIIWSKSEIWIGMKKVRGRFYSNVRLISTCRPYSSRHGRGLQSIFLWRSTQTDDVSLHFLQYYYWGAWHSSFEHALSCR